MSEVKNSNASVADYLAFEALPEETKSLIQRLYGTIWPRGRIPKMTCEMRMSRDGKTAPRSLSGRG
jgi:hypothetical protein